MKSLVGIRPTMYRFVFMWVCAAGCLQWSDPVHAHNPLSGAAIQSTYAVSSLASGLTIESDLPQIGGYHRTTVKGISLSGTADPEQTRSVLVNGLPARWWPQEGRWEYADLSGGIKAIVVSGSAWKYLDDGADPGAAWRNPDFDDAGWRSGRAELGYGDGDEATVVRFGPDSGHKHMTTYFRHGFVVSDASSYESLRLRLLCDDGAVVYLNGAEVARRNMPAGEIQNTTRATVSVGGPDENAFQEYDLPPGLIETGLNVLAVEVHQSSGSSSDLSFDLALDGIEPVLATGALFPGVNRITVQTFDGPAGVGREIDRQFIDVWYDTGRSVPVSGVLIGRELPTQRLGMQIADGYLPGIPVEVRLQVVLPDGTVDRDLWDGTARLVTDSPGVTASVSSVRLYNGQGTARVSFSGAGDFNLTATMDNMKATRYLRDRSNEPVRNRAGTLDIGSANWQGIIRITGDLLIPPGLTLTIQPGTLVLVDGVASGDKGVDIDVQGAIQSLGAADSPVVFTATDPSRPWGEIHHQGGTVSRYRHTQIILAGHAPGGGHTGRGPAVRAQNAAIEFDQCVLADIAGKTMQASGSDLAFRHCVLARSVMGPEIQGTALLFEDCWITEMLNPDDSDGIYIHGQSAGQICLMKGGVVADIKDDCIDTLGSEVTLEDLIIRDAQDKGVSIYGGTVNIHRCLIVENNRAPEDPTIAVIATKTFEGSAATVNIDSSTIVASKVQGHTDVAIQSHNKYGVKAGAIIYNVSNSIIEATDPISIQAPYLESDVHVQFSNVFGESWAGQGTINADPLFVNRAGHDYHLREDSPCRGMLLANGAAADIGYYSSITDKEAVSSNSLVWKADQGPYRVTEEATVPAGMTLFVEPGTSVFFESEARLLVRGQLIAEGQEYQPIRFTRTPLTRGTWRGIQLDHAAAENRLRWAVLEYGRTNDGMLGVVSSDALVEHVTFDHTDLRRLRFQGASLIVRDSVFTDIFDADQPPTTDNLSEHIWGTLPAGGRLLIERNSFGRIKGHNDCIDLDGPSRPEGVIEIRDNVFLGGGDDALDLEGDAHIEGNRFLHFQRDPYNKAAGNSNMISAGAGKDYVVVRNVFYDAGHVAQIKDGSFMVFTNNTVVQIANASLYFDLPGHTRSSGRGADVDGCIFWQVAEPLLDRTSKVQELTLDRSIVPAAWHVLGMDNIDTDPLFVDPGADWQLLPNSVARNTGPWGLDRGAYIPAGAAIWGIPDSVTPQTMVVLSVGGPGIISYKYTLNDPVNHWSEEQSVDVPILLSNLEPGHSYIVSVVGKDSAGRWQTQPTRSGTWTLPGVPGAAEARNQATPIPYHLNVSEEDTGRGYTVTGGEVNHRIFP